MKGPMEMMSWRAYSLNTPKDEVLKVEIPKNATYDIVVEKLWLGLLESGVSQDVKVHEILCAGKQLQNGKGNCDILGGKPLDYYAFAGYPLLFKYFSYRDYCRDHPDCVALRMGESSWIMNVEVPDTFDIVLERTQLRGDIAIPKHPGLTINGCRMPRRGKTLFDMGVKPGSTVVITDDWQYEYQVTVKTLVGITIVLNVTADDKIEEVKKKINDKHGMKLRPDQQRLIYGKCLLEDGRMVIDYDIKQNSTFYWLLRLRGGAEPQFFADVSDSNAMTSIKWSKSASSWRWTDRGLCLEGECRNTACKAYSHMVIMNAGFNDLDLMRDSDVTKCPECLESVIPITCAFNNCMWMFDGKKTGEDTVVHGDWKRTGDEYHRFNESTGVEWYRLLLRVREVPSSAKQSVTDGVKMNKTLQPSAVYVDYTWNMCTICLRGMGIDGNDQHVVECGHHFHSGCIPKWHDWCQSEDVSCPNCRRVSKL